MWEGCPPPCLSLLPVWEGHHGGDPLWLWFSGLRMMSLSERRGCHPGKMQPLDVWPAPWSVCSVPAPQCWSHRGGGQGAAWSMGAASPEDRVPFQHLWQDGVVGGRSCSPKPDAPSLVLCCHPPPALASQTTAACGESGWSLRGWAQVLGREGRGRGSEGAVFPWPARPFPTGVGGVSMLTPLPLPPEVNSHDGEGVREAEGCVRAQVTSPSQLPGAAGWGQSGWHSPQDSWVLSSLPSWQLGFQ